MDVRYGPDIPTDAELRLCGNVEGKRVLELGCKAQTAIAFAQQGAHAIGVDSNPDHLASFRRRAEEEEVKVELHESDLADLAFVRADSVDLAFSSMAFDLVEDLNRVFRQVHRVLRQEAPLLFSVSHPAYAMIDDADIEVPLLIRRSYFEKDTGLFQRRTISELFTGLIRANFRVDTILEPSPIPAAPRSPEWRETFRSVPRTLIIRARKEGL